VLGVVLSFLLARMRTRALGAQREREYDDNGESVRA
jgi:hypothetical protein